MASNLYSVMTWKQAIEEFNACVLPQVQAVHEQDGIRDIPARSEAWCDWTDSLCKNRIISDWQYMNWPHPATCEY
jgi:hypothetical protein